MDIVPFVTGVAAYAADAFAGSDACTLCKVMLAVILPRQSTCQPTTQTGVSCW